MSSTKPTPYMGMSTALSKRQQKIQKGLALTQMYLVSSSVVPATLSTGPRIWESLKLPSLTNMAHQKTQGITEPALFIPGQRPLCDTFYQKFCPSQKFTSPLACKRTDTPTLACRPVYTHFSFPIRPLPRLNRVARLAQNLNNRHLVKEHQSPGCQMENLSIKGLPCFSKALPTKAPKQLHVFLPTEGTAEEDDQDGESIDEGFLDEVDHRIVLKEQEGEAKIL